MILKLIREGKVTGLRVDHPDGLYNPSEYFHWLQRSCFVQIRLGYLERLKDDIPSDLYKKIKEDTPLSAKESDVETEILRQYDEILSSNPYYKPFYIVGEKILTRGERMSEDWPIFSTTGYVFLNSVNGIFVKTEIPDDWRKYLINWRKLNKKKKPVVEGQRVPDLNKEYLLYQTLIGIWPVNPMNDGEYETFKQRTKDYILKAVREAKVNTIWINPNTIYEDALMFFIESIMDNKSENQFLKDFISFQKKFLIMVCSIPYYRRC
jgi:maltooligosyltrehalose synthase